MLATVYHMLVLTLGEPPTQFTYAFRDKNGGFSVRCLKDSD